jgi:hypothetical protein
MANRRMFSNRIANSAKFLQMPAESQLLYFHMVQRADDDGILEAYPLLKLLGLASDNFKLLQAKGYIKQLNEDQVIVITDWVEHNYIRADRKVDSIYKNLLVEVAPEIKTIEAKPRSDVEDNSKRIGGQSKDGIGKDRLGKVKLSKDRVEIPPNEDFIKFYKEYPNKKSREEAQRSWLKINPSKELFIKIMSALEVQKKSSTWVRDNGQYIPHPSTWLNQKRWEDEIELPASKTLILNEA